MSYSFKYKFISPQGIYATVEEELKSYFSTGAIDNLMFPTYTNKALNHLGKSSYYITEDLLHLEDFQAKLPDNFYAVREAWLCTEFNLFPAQTPNSLYTQATSLTTIQVSPIISGGAPCTNENCPSGNCDECMPELIQAVYKSNHQVPRTYKKSYLLKPGNISAKSHCHVECANFGSNAKDSFDIHDNKFLTNFRKGTVYLVFYATEYDNNQNQMIPDNFFIKEYIEKYIKFKMFETLCNQINDETFNQLMQKKAEAKVEMDEAFILANVEVRKQTVEQKLISIRSQDRRFRHTYELPNRYFRYWRNVQ